HGFARALAEQRISRALPGEREQRQKMRIVVKHLLEVRYEPALVHRVAGKAAAQMVVDAAFANARERVLDRREEPVGPDSAWPGAARRVLSSRSLGRRPLAGAPDQLEGRGLRELGRAAQAAIERIERAEDACR